MKVTPNISFYDTKLLLMCARLSQRARISQILTAGPILMLPQNQHFRYLSGISILNKIFVQNINC